MSYDWLQLHSYSSSDRTVRIPLETSAMRTDLIICCKILGKDCLRLTPFSCDHPISSFVKLNDLDKYKRS